jgi:hypothetical protein
VWAIKRRELRSFCGIYKVFSIPLRPGKKRRGALLVLSKHKEVIERGRGNKIK